MKYYLLLNAIEITIISKLTEEIGNEYKSGVKYKIIPKSDGDDNPSPALEPVPVPVPVPVPGIEENYIENLLTQLLNKSKEYVYYIIDFLKSPEVVAVVGSVVIVAATVALLSAISGVCIPALIGGGMTALATLIQSLLNLNLVPA